MRRLCFLSMDDLGGYVADDELAVAPLARLGWTTDTLSWRQTSVPWSQYEAVVIRTPWDYQRSPEEFLDVLAAIERATVLHNPLEIVRWNLDKRYLRDLEAKGAAIVPTLWGEAYSQASFAEWQAELDSSEIIVKPTVSATAEHTYRLAVWEASLEDVFHGRDLMVQPFLQAIVDEGEYSLFYFNGDYSHAILKTPKQQDFRVQEEHGGIITRIDPDEEMRAAAARALAAAGETLLYARVDLVRHGGQFLVMELELIEPALYLRMDDGAADRFAAAVDASLQ